MAKKLAVVLVVLYLVGCSTPTPQIVRETVIVKETVTVKETVIVTQPPLSTNTPYPTYTPQEPLPTYTLPPTYTPRPTYTKPPKPTSTPGPTNTPKPTATPTASPTPVPTATPVPPPEPIVYTGTGDTILDIESPVWLVTLHIVGNAGGQHFAVTSYDKNGEYIDLLVNTTDPYDGYRPIGLLDQSTVTRLEITGGGEWRLEALPLELSREGHVLMVPGTYEGTSDDVVFIGQNLPDKATIRGNQASAHFGVIGHNGGWDLLVNTTDPYDGTVLLHIDTYALEITAEGAWSIAVTDRP